MHEFRLAFVLLALLLPSTGWTQGTPFEQLSQEAEEAYHSGDYVRSRALSARALELAGFDAVGAIDQLGRLGAASEKLRDYAAAEQHYRQMLTALEQLSGRDSINSAFGMEALARVLVHRQRVDEAQALFARVVNARRIMVIGREDPFRIRHDTMRSLLALAREDWRAAFDGYLTAVNRLEHAAQVNLPDHLEGLASETNVATFIGLARAAWNLQKAPGSDAKSLMDTTFKAVQWKWRTAAGEALLLASERTKSSTDQQSLSTRQEQDTAERLRRLKTDQETLEQRWIKKKESDPAYRQVWDRQMAAWRSVKPDEMLKQAKELQKQTKEILDGQKRRQEAWKKYQSESTPENKAEVERLEKEFLSKPVPMTPTISAPAADYSKELSALEKAIPGYDEYTKENVRLAEQIAALEQQPPPQTTTATSSSPPRSAKAPADLDPLGISQVQALMSASDALITFLIGHAEAFVWVVTRNDARWASIAIGEAELGALVFALRCGLDHTMWRGDRAIRCRELLGKEPTEETINGARVGVYPFDAERAYRLYKLLLEPFGDLIRDKRLLIVPSGALTTLPFNVLLAAPPKAAHPAGLRRVPHSRLARRAAADRDLAVGGVAQGGWAI